MIERKNLLMLFFLLLFVSLFIFSHDQNVSAAEPETEVTHVVRIENLTYFTVNTSVEFHSSDGHNASELRALYASGNSTQKHDIETNFTDAVLMIASEMISELFNGSYNYHIEAEIDQPTLAGPVADGYPIVVYANSSALLSRESYDLPETATIEDVIYGTFNMGAIIRLDITLLTPSSSTASYTFYPPSNISIDEHTTGILGPDHVIWYVDNTDNDHPEVMEELRLRSPYAPGFDDEDIEVTVVLDRIEFDQTRVTVEIQINTVMVSKYGNLSRNIVSLEYISADGIRMVVGNGLNNWTWEKIYQKGIDSNHDAIEKSLSEALNLTVDLVFQWDNDTLEGYEVDTMGTEPPIRATLESDDITPQLYAIGEESFGIDDLRVARGFLNAGGKADFSIPVIDLELGIRPTAMLILSPGMGLESYSSGVETKNDNRYNNRWSYQWDPRDEFTGIIYSTESKEYTDQKIEINVEVDLEEIKINYARLQDSSMEVDITGNLDFYRLETPSQIEESLPDGIYIDYIISDIIRLAYDSGLINLDEIDEMIDEETEDIEEELKDAFDESTFLRVDIVDESLTESYDVEHMGDTNPIRIVGFAHISMTVSGGDGGDSASEGFLNSFILKEFTMDFPLSPINGWTISYKVILPPGIVITQLSDDLGIAEKGTDNGRDWVKVTITDNEDNLTITIGITPMFIIHICFFPIMIILLLIVALVYHRRQKKKIRKLKEKAKAEIMAKKSGSENVKFSVTRLDKKKRKSDHVDRPRQLRVSISRRTGMIPEQRSLTPDPHAGKSEETGFKPPGS